jgi:ubiquinone/menaquinone biosynthesis C-methylase UbiE
MTDREASISKYESEASSYDAQYQERTGADRRRALASLGLTAGETVIDAGCGTGLCFPIIEEAIGPSGRIVGIDQSAEMLKRAENRVEREGWRNVTLIRSAVEDATIPYDADAVVFYATHDIMRTSRAIENVVARLKAQGRVLAVGLMWGPWWALTANLKTFRMARRYVTTLEGLAEPWSKLEPLLSDLRVDRRTVRGRYAYLALGRK